MNVVVTAILIAVFSALGFCIGCFACLTKINRLEQDNRILKKWLDTSRSINNQLIDQNNELMNDLEAVVNGKHIVVPSTDMSDEFEIIGDFNTKTD